MENKHTKAPWAVNTDRFVGKKHKIVVHAHPRRIATCYIEDNEVFVSKEEALANAKLIAAAPDLLEALIQYEKNFQQLLTVKLGLENEQNLRTWFTFCTKDAKKAIKKATE